MTYTKTIPGLLFNQVARDPDKLAIIATGLAPLTFAELGSQVEQIGRKLRISGIAATSRVGIVLPRSPEAVLISVAVASYATAVPLNPTLHPSELRQELERFSLDAIVLPAWIE